MKQIDLQFVKDTLSELDPSLEGSEQDESYLTAVVVVSALVHGPDKDRLATFTGLPPEFVETIRRRMIRAELWRDIDVFYDHSFGKGNMVRGTAIWLDVLIAQGLVVRQWDAEARDYRYLDAGYARGCDDNQEKIN